MNWIKKKLESIVQHQKTMEFRGSFLDSSQLELHFKDILSAVSDLLFRSGEDEDFEEKAMNQN